MRRLNIRSGIALIAMITVIACSTVAAYAYFTDYDHLLGAAKLSLSGETEIEEEVTDTEKTVSVKNTGEEGKNASVVVKLLIYGPDGMKVTLSDSSDWTAFNTEKGVYGYYYNHVLAPGESTSKVVASVADIPAGADMTDFQIIVLQESSTAVYDEDGKIAAPDGWDGFPEIRE